MLDLPIQFIYPNEITQPQTMNSESAQIDPELMDFDQLAYEDQKALVVHLIEKAVSDIEEQGRGLTEWEADTLTGAIGAAMSGMFKLAMTKIELSQLKRKAAVHPQIWYSNTEQFTCFQIRASLSLLH
jgi:hypothetical protein